jgi:hypothetical protein
MPAHPDAVGYLCDLSSEVNEPWFQILCDRAAVGDASVLDTATLAGLRGLYLRTEEYIGPGPASPAIAHPIQAVPEDVIERLSGFRHFKLLGDTLEINFTKRITLIFGTNGSGKSSLCESLKTLATIESPTRPLENVRVQAPASPEFQYKFRSDGFQQSWTVSSGYGRTRC